MKNLIIIFLIVIISHVAFSQAFNIQDYGAKHGELSTEAIQKAVDECHESGGGQVLVPSGTYITGTIVLKSYVDLHLQQGATLQGSLSLNDYKTTFRRHGIIFCENAEQVSITGEGIIDARGINFYDTTANHVYEEFDKSKTRQKENYMPEGQFFTDGPVKKLPKPGMTIAFFHCSRLSLKDVTIKDTPSWAVRFGYCDDVLVQGISIVNNLMVPNSDGVHCTASRNVRMSDCDIRAGDDAFIITGFSKDEETPGYSLNEQLKYNFGNKTLYSENISVNNCQLQSRSAGIRIGYGQHPIRNCTFSNIVIYESNRGIGIFAHDASNIENLIFSDIVIETRLHNGQWWGNGEPIHLSSISRFKNEPVGIIRNVQFNNIIAQGEHGILIYGHETSPMENISFNKVSLRVVNGKETLSYGGNFDLRPATPIEKQIFEHDIPGIYAQHVKGLYFSDFILEWGAGLPVFFTYALEAHNVNNLYMSNFRGKSNPTSSLNKPYKLIQASIDNK